MRTLAHILVFLTFAQSLTARTRDPVHDAQRIVQSKSAWLKENPKAAPGERANVQMQLGQAAEAALDPERAVTAYQAALETLGPLAAPSSPARVQLLRSTLRAQFTAGAWQQSADSAAILQRLYEAAQGPAGTTVQELLFQRWRALDLARDPGAAAVEKTLRARAPYGAWVRRLTLSQRTGPAALFSYSGAGAGGSLAYFFVDGTGRPLTEAFTYAKPFTEGLALVQKGNVWGALDEEMRLRVPLRYRSLQTIPGQPRRLLAILPGTGRHPRRGLLDGAGKVLVPFEYKELGPAVGDFLKGVRGPDAPTHSAEGRPLPSTEYFHVSDGSSATKKDYQIAEYQAKFERPPYAPYRLQKGAKSKVLRDRKQAQVFPPVPAVPALEGLRKILFVYRSLVAAEYRPGNSGNRSVALWDLERKELVLPPTAGVRKLSFFVEDVAIAETHENTYGLLRVDGSWKKEPSAVRIKKLDPENGLVHFAGGLGTKLVRSEGQPFTDHVTNLVGKMVAGLLPATVLAEEAKPRLGDRESWTANALDAEGRPVWPLGRLRLVDNQLSLLLTENWAMTAYTFGRLSLAHGPSDLRFFKPKPEDYTHAAELHALVFDASPAAKREVVQAQILKTFTPQGLNDVVTVGPDQVSLGRNWHRFSTVGKYPANGATRLGEGALWLGEHTGVALFLVGIRGAVDRGEAGKVAKRLAHLVETARLQSDEGF